MTTLRPPRALDPPSPGAVWHLVTGEYPPDPGGVSDYTRQLAEALHAAGHRVEVWAPGTEESDGASAIKVHRLRRGFSAAGLWELVTGLRSRKGAHRLFLQYTPNAFGWRAMNAALPWALKQTRLPLWVMFHEVAWPRIRGQSARRRLLASVQEAMARQLVGGAERLFVSTDAWTETLKRLVPSLPPVQRLPIFSSIVSPPSPDAIEGARQQWRLDAGRTVGTFSSYDPWVLEGLTELAPALLQPDPHRKLVLIGRRAEIAAQKIAERTPGLAAQLVVVGERAPEAVAELLCASDVVLQYYPDGVTTRRSTAVAALALGRPLVTNRGHLTEPFWEEAPSPVVLAPSAALLAAKVDELLGGHHPDVGARGRAWYQAHASIEVALGILTAPMDGPT